MPARTTPLRLVADPVPAPPPSGGAPGRWRRALWIIAPLACLGVFVGAGVRAGGEERALRALPPAQRAALYHRTMDTLRSVCAGEARNELRDMCRGQAELALLFPECDAACQATVREQLRTPTR